jgi:phosphonate transport system ATP-binding protein
MASKASPNKDMNRVITLSNSFSMPSDSVICTNALEVIYKNNLKALKSTSLDIAQGSVVVLLGTSGAGKSTLLRSLNGLVKPTAGCVTAAGLGDIADPSTLQRHRRQTGMIFQQHHLIGRLSVLNNVLLGRLGHHSGWRMFCPWTRSEKEQALAVIDRVGLLERALARADQLSGGQQQRVGMARALIQQPRLLLADEPIASLDPNTSLRLLQLLHDICKSDGLTAVISLHQVDFARQFADRIIGLKQGTVVFDGPPQALSERHVKELYRHHTSAEASAASTELHPTYFQQSSPIEV